MVALVISSLITSLHILRLTALMLLATVIMPAAHATELGTYITNVASMSYEQEGGERISIRTNEATFRVTGLPTASTIEFFRVSPNSPLAVPTQINGSDYSPSGSEDGPFEVIGNPINGATLVDITTPVPLTPASTYATGELMFVRVTDPGQNGNKDTIETVTTVITSDTGDAITLKLYESGHDTGEFWAYIPSTREASAVNDNVLTTNAQTQLTAKYTDKFDAQEISVDTALIDPYSRVFNSLTGDLIDNALVTLINEDTGQPATVYGVDGLSIYPSSVVSGQSVRDGSGFVYEMRDGEFRFPVLLEGDYRIEVVTPEGYSFSSVYTGTDFNGLDNGPFDTADGSYGNAFAIDMPGPLKFDVPIDPHTDIIINKTANPARGDVGDFIEYTVQVQNAGDVSASLKMIDYAPDGFRYVSGSSALSGAAVADPEVNNNGYELGYFLPILAPGETYELSYVMQIGAKVTKGEHVNSASVVDGSSRTISNIARASVFIEEDLFRSTSTIIGRVTENSCDADEDWAREISIGDGVEGVRLYMEDGAYVVTDQDGLYNFQGVELGTHVVQLDEATLPAGYKLMICEENSQYSGKEIGRAHV